MTNSDMNGTALSLPHLSNVKNVKNVKKLQSSGDLDLRIIEIEFLKCEFFFYSPLGPQGWKNPKMKKIHVNLTRKREKIYKKSRDLNHKIIKS
jgi:hypothetical protein